MRFARFRFFSLLLTVFTASAMSMGASSSMAAVGHVRSAIDTAASFPSFSTSASRNEYVVLQAWQTDRLHALKEANPAVKVLVYKNLGFSAQTSSSPTGPSSSGVAYNEAQDSWFLRNTQGERFTSWSFNWLWAMDVGSSSYQKQWASNVISELDSQGWDGVMLDDASPTLKYQYDSSEVAKYPDDASYSAAMESALAYIGPRIAADGKLAIPNFATWAEYPETCNRWLQYVSGALDEMFVKWGKGSGEGYRGEGQWSTQVRDAEYATSHGKIFLAYTQGSVGETQAARYGYASLLLGSDGRGAYAFTPDYSTETWLPEYEFNLGDPLGQQQEDASGIRRRAFEHGLVLVNPTNTTLPVEFGGTYSGSGLTNAREATMQPHTALVMTGAPEAAPVEVTEEEPAEAKEEVVAPIDVTVAVGNDKVHLHWSKGGGKRVLYYRVVRNSRKVARTRHRRRVDRHVSKHRVYRYRIYGLDARGKVIARSRLVRVKPGGPRRKVVQRSRSSA